LRAYYWDHEGIAVDDIPEIDYPLTRPDGHIVSLVEASRAGAPFDWVVASHVIEHVPNLIGWLAELAEVVTDGGSLVLVVPDRRYCFDAHRPPTSVGAMLEADRLGAIRPGVRAVYDYFSRAVHYDAEALWAGVLPHYSDRFHSLEEAEKSLEESLESYVDCHVWLFTPDSFAEQLHELRLIGRSDWYVDELIPTPTNQIEFMARLRRLPRGTPTREPVADEVVPTRATPDWLDDDGRTRRVAELEDTVAELERSVAELQERLARREGRAARLRAKVVRQRRTIAGQRAELEQLRTSLPVRAARLGHTCVRGLNRWRRPRA
jgi:SAM-dependent methyltransferase